MKYNDIKWPTVTVGPIDPWLLGVWLGDLDYDASEHSYFLTVCVGDHLGHLYGQRSFLEDFRRELRSIQGEQEEVIEFDEQWVMSDNDTLSLEDLNRMVDVSIDESSVEVSNLALPNRVLSYYRRTTSWRESIELAKEATGAMYILGSAKDDL